MGRSDRALDLAHVVAIVQEGFDATGKDAGVGPSRIVVLCGGHPQRSMQVADALWRATPEGATAEAETWETALADVRRSVDLGSERVFSLLTIGAGTITTIGDGRHRALSQCIRRLQGVEIGFSSIEQASAVYDVVEHRVLSVPIDEALTELEIEEVMHLVSFMHRLRR